MAYYHDTIYQVWYKDDIDTEWVFDTDSFDKKEMVEYCNRTIADIENNPNWGYRGFVMKIVEIDNPEYDIYQVEQDNKGDYLYHI